VVLLVPGAGSQPLPALSSIAGKKKGGLDGLLPGSNDTVKELTGTLTALRKLLEDQNLTGGVKELLTSTTNTMNTFGETANSVNGLIVRNSTKFDLALASAVKSMQNVQGVTKELYALTKSGKLQGDMTAITANLRKSSEKADALMAEFTALVSDPKLKKDLQTTTGNIAEMSASGVKMAKNGEKIAEDAAAMTEDGKVISKEIVELTKKFNEIAVKINDIADDVKSTVKKVGGTIGAVAGGPKLGNIETTFDVLHESKPSHLRTDFSAVFPQTGGDYFQIGLFDAFESNKLIAQIGRKIDEQLSIRYGIFASKPGIGVDYSVGNRLSLRGDVFSLNDPRTDLRLKYDFGKGFVGWLGVNQAFKKNVPVFGFGTKH
jgi:phospholipid/cholesterol/gamma-HCH transport system substrate-binding protein